MFIASVIACHNIFMGRSEGTLARQQVLGMGQCSVNIVLFHQEEQQRVAAKEKALKEREEAKQREAAHTQVH